MTHLKTYNLHLVLIHYISHKEALLVAYVSKDFHQFKFVDKLLKKDLEVLVHFLCVKNKCMEYYINLLKFGDN